MLTGKGNGDRKLGGERDIWVYFNVLGRGEGENWEGIKAGEGERAGWTSVFTGEEKGKKKIVRKRH